MFVRWVRVFVPTFALGCATTGPDVDSGGDGPSFAEVIHPMFVPTCGTCHAEEAPVTPYRGPGDFGSADVDVAYASVRVYVNAGSPDTSLLYLRVSTDDIEEVMPPPPGLLTEAEIATIAEWIEGGALE